MISVGEAIPGQRSVCGGKPGPVVLGLLGCLGSFVASRGKRGPLAFRPCLRIGLPFSNDSNYAGLQSL